MGYITKSCEDTFSSKEKYDKFVEANLLEFKRAERGLSTLCISLTNDIEKVLSTTYPKAKLHFFGSRISGLAKIKSDIDVFIDVGKQKRIFETLILRSRKFFISPSFFEQQII